MHCHQEAWILFQVYAIGLLITMIQLLRKFSDKLLLTSTKSTTYYEAYDAPKKVAVVTGASSGIGLAVAKKLIKRNYIVIAPIKHSPDNHLSEVEYLKMDLGCLASVKNAAASVKSSYRQIDLLVNCAGIMFAPFDCSESGLEQHFVVNYLGHFLFTLLIIPLLIASPNSAVVNVTSSLHHLGHPDVIKSVIKPTLSKYSPHLAYANSKLALVLFTYKMQRKFSSIASIAYDPGTVHTKLYKSTHPFTAWFVRNFGKFFLRKPPDAADDILTLIDTKPNSNFALYCGWKRKFCHGSSLSKNQEFQDKVWNLSLKQTEAFL